MVENVAGLNQGAVDEVDWDSYEDASGEFQLPEEGEYTFRAPDQDGFEIGETQNGDFKATFTAVVDGGPYDGFEARYTSVSGKVFQRGKSKTKVSQLGDYLRAVGSNARPSSRDKDQQTAAVKSTAGSTFKAFARWEGQCKACQTRVNGMSRFQNGSGEPQQTIACPSCKAEVRARFRVNRYISAV